ncbi:hypothetical protein CHELA1G11_13237 [Hyphomicrobiales bacterium]|nr:hypothetical protein CHELA1G2_11074 [Hyphomicrobiales bacterium]CAH1670262.1 hypothetical protein CHELA1G11_13237 [Hyphomicrobiales bacterium]
MGSRRGTPPDSIVPAKQRRRPRGAFFVQSDSFGRFLSALPDSLAESLGLDGRSERIRTSDPLVPNEVRYQTALHSDIACREAGLIAVLSPVCKPCRANKCILFHSRRKFLS